MSPTTPDLKSKLRVLLVSQQNGKNHSNLKQILQQKATVESITDLTQLSNHIINTTPDVLFFEDDFPSSENLDTLQKTKQHFPSIPIILVTENNSEALVVWALRARIWNYFVKPFVIDELFETLERLAEITVLRNQHRPREAIMPRQPTNIRDEAPTFNREEQAIHKAIIHTQRHLHEKISQAKVAELCGMTSSQFSRTFKRVCEITFQEFLLQSRIQEAIRLLKNPSASITDVGYTVGFQDLSYFTRMFRRYAGITPSEYKQRIEEIRDTLSTATDPYPPSDLLTTEYPLPEKSFLQDRFARVVAYGLQ